MESNKIFVEIKFLVPFSVLVKGTIRMILCAFTTTKTRKKKKKGVALGHVYSGRTPEYKILISEIKFFMLFDFLFRLCDIVVTAKSQESLWHLLAFVHLR